jgi:hypothetical protein
MTNERFDQVFPAPVEKVVEGKKVTEEIRGKYRNVLDKIRNGKLGNFVAWQEFEEVAEYIDPEFGRLIPKAKGALRLAFGYRRDFYIGRISEPKMETEINRVIGNLDYRERPQVAEFDEIAKRIFTNSQPKTTKQ